MIPCPRLAGVGLPPPLETWSRHGAASIASPGQANPRGPHPALSLSQSRPQRPQTGRDYTDGPLARLAYRRSSYTGAARVLVRLVCPGGRGLDPGGTGPPVPGAPAAGTGGAGR